MPLESFPNELFLELFTYFNGIDLLRVFYGLNSRMNNLLHNQFRTYRCQFQSISKHDYSSICQQHFPLIADRIIGLSLADNDKTLEQLNMFLFYHPSWNLFIRLRTLSLSNIPSSETLFHLLDQCHQLLVLTDLKLSDPYFRLDPLDLQLVVNKIWSLPQLHRCDIHLSKTPELFSMPTKISLSLQYLSVKGNPFQWKQIHRLFRFTPSLTHLSVSISISDHEQYKPFLHPTLVELKLLVYFTSDFSKMQICLENMHHLRCLEVHFMTGLIDGHRWEEFIRTYLPNLKILRFSMNRFFNEFIPQELITSLINSYRTSFWLDEHQWFVRCLTWGRSVYLYTLSHTFGDFGDTYNYPHSWISTCPNDNQQSFCDQINDIACETFFQQIIPSSLRLFNIEYLNIKLPIPDQFWSIVPSLNRLQSLTILPSSIDTFQFQLQILLDRAPHLFRLTIHHDQSLPTQMSLFKCTHTSIRQLDLKHRYHCFNEQECQILAHSSFGMQCEELFISVNTCQCILFLVNNMNHLRYLDVRCYDRMFSRRLLRTENGSKKKKTKKKLTDRLKDYFQFANCKHSPKLENDEESENEDDIIDKLIQWLQEHLPSTYSIVRNPKFSESILIWIY